jgi:endonuclease/exonuclease/phosphatase family metal-dependent hydrolase
VAGLRVVTWNVRDLLGDPFALRRVLRSLSADVVCLQEAPRRPGGAWRTGRLARDAGLRHAGGGRLTGGTALLLGPHVGVTSLATSRLPVRGLFTRTRGLVVAELAVVSGPATGLTLTVACLHLPLEPDLRVRHARLVARTLARRPAPYVVCGDFNEPPGSPAWQELASLACDPAPDAAPTFPAGREHVRLDAVLVGAGLRVVQHGSGDVVRGDVVAATDHLPVVADLEPVDGPPGGATTRARCGRAQRGREDREPDGTRTR